MSLSNFIPLDSQHKALDPFNEGTPITFIWKNPVLRLLIINYIL